MASEARPDCGDPMPWPNHAPPKAINVDDIIKVFLQKARGEDARGVDLRHPCHTVTPVPFPNVPVQPTGPHHLRLRKQNLGICVPTRLCCMYDE